MSQVMVVYARENTDAWCGAWIMDRCFGGVQLIESSERDVLPMVDGRTVFCVGIPYSKKQADYISEYAHRAVIIDHKDSTVKDFSENESCVHDRSRSSGVIAYDWCCYKGYIDNYSGSGKQNNRAIANGMLWIAKYVQDRELGRKKMPNSWLINLCIQSYDQDLQQWDMLATRASVTPEALTMDGIAIDRYIKRKRVYFDTSIENEGE